MNLNEKKLENIYLTILGVLGVIGLIFIIVGLIVLAMFISNVG